MSTKYLFVHLPKIQSPHILNMYTRKIEVFLTQIFIYKSLLPSHIHVFIFSLLSTHAYCIKSFRTVQRAFFCINSGFWPSKIHKLLKCWFICKKSLPISFKFTSYNVWRVLTTEPHFFCFKEELHLKPKFSMFCALSLNCQHFC